MKKIKKIAILILLITFITLYGLYLVNMHVSKRLMTLQVIENFDNRILAQDIDSSVEYEITFDSSFKIMDEEKNTISFEKLKKDDIIKVYYSGNIEEVSPGKFEKIKKIIYLN